MSWPRGRVLPPWCLLERCSTKLSYTSPDAAETTNYLRAIRRARIKTKRSSSVDKLGQEIKTSLSLRY